MRFFKVVFWVLWRVWLYVLIAVPILVMFPFLLLSISRERWYPYFFVMARIWGKFILYGMGFYYRIETLQQPEAGKSYMFIANHTSMADIMLMLASVRHPFVFVGKKELAKIPLFGFFYKRTSIMVDRSSAKSRMDVFRRAQRRLQQGLSICIFPEGGVPDESVVLDEFKDGAFRLAVEHQIDIVPLVFLDNKKRFSYTFFSGSPGMMRVRILPFISTEGFDGESKKDIRELREKARGLMLAELLDQ
jgi:1-acyl-sn-glycerol-3-phosphate acyltransferase